MPFSFPSVLLFLYIPSGATLLGFVGTPWTLAAYSIEGKADKECKETKVSMGVA